MYAPVGSASQDGPPRAVVARDSVLCCLIAAFTLLVLALVVSLGGGTTHSFLTASTGGRDGGAGQVEVNISSSPATSHDAEYERTSLPNTTTKANGEAPRCVPRVCLRPKNFTYDYAELGIVDYTMLASFPGSGNTFIRSVIEEGTRIYTGSMYDDTTLSDKYEFLGERLPPFHEPIMSVVKTHYPMYTPLNAKLTGAVYIMRSPWDAMVSEFNREHGEWSKTKHNATHATPWEFETEFSLWADRMHKEWLRSVRFWAEPGALTHVAEHDVVSPLLNRSVDVHHHHFVPVLVLLYEDFVREFEVTVRRLFAFLKPRLRDAMPSVDDAVLCALHNRQRAMSLKRYSKPPYNPWVDYRVRVHGERARLCDEFGPFWLTNKWGECHQGKLQVERNVSVKSWSDVVECDP